MTDQKHKSLFDATKGDIAREIANVTPFSSGRVLHVIQRLGSIDSAIWWIEYGVKHNVDPVTAALSASMAAQQEATE